MGVSKNQTIELSRLNPLIERTNGYLSSGEHNLIKKAFWLSDKAHRGQFRETGEPFIEHPLEVAIILAELHLDASSIVTALLHDVVEDTSITLQEIKKNFGKSVAFLVDGVTKLSQVKFKSNYEKESESIRKMFVSMGKDVRVILVKLADRLHNMRTLAPLSEERQLRISRETLSIYAPLAGRLGLHSIKMELEDLAFKYIYPEVYSSIFRQFEKETAERNKYIKNVIAFLTEELSKKTKVKFEIKVRTKNMYSIYKKMQNQKILYAEVYDIIAFRICVQKMHECYEILGWVHSLWKPIPGRFKDFIAIPKANNYQSLHTTVIGPQGKKLEIQIRTYDMHYIAEKGVAAHWQYKDEAFLKNVKIRTQTLKKFSWLQDLVALYRQAQHPNVFLESVKKDLFESDIYVFTPKGDVKEFSSGATAIDFAYAVHTDIGNKLKEAKVNGRIVPLKYKLQNGDVIEVSTSEKSHPIREWLSCCTTSKARSRIRSYIKDEERKIAVQVGQKLLDKELKKVDCAMEKFLKKPECKKTMVNMGLNTHEDVYAQIGYGKIIIQNFIQKVLGKDLVVPKISEAPKKTRKKQNSPIEVEGIGSVVVQMAKCCAPLTGEDILGYISMGRGIVVHQRECKKLQDLAPERYVDVSWRVKDGIKHTVYIKILAYDETGTLSDISNVFNEKGINILELNSISKGDGLKAELFLSFEVRNIEELRSIIRCLEQVKNVVSVSRSSSSSIKY